MGISYLVVKKIIFYRNRILFEEKIRNKIYMTYRPYCSNYMNLELKNLKLKYHKCWKYTTDKRICNIICEVINRLDYTSKRRKIIHNFMTN